MSPGGTANHAGGTPSAPITAAGQKVAERATVTVDPGKTVASATMASGGEPAGATAAGYQIVCELGRGGMGIVYRAIQLRAQREVALKMVRTGQGARAEELSRFRGEIEAVARLQHPHVVAMYDIGEHDGQPFFSMELCPRGSLAGAMRGVQWPLRQAAEMLRKIATGVAAAHAVGIVHRDLKPQNVLLTAEGEPKVSDFGLAKQLFHTDADRASLTETGAVLGTPSYMAPEQAFGGSKRVGPEADVYSLGAILYELLTGRPPFTGQSVMDIIVQVVGEEPTPPRQLRKDVPRDLEFVCIKCLEKDPQRRYHSAESLATELSRFLDGEPVSAARSGLLDRVAGALERVQLQDRFLAYGSLLRALAPVMLIPEILVTVICWYEQAGVLLLLTQCARITGFLAVVQAYRGGQWLPQGPAERQLWSLWGGYVLCCFTAGAATRIAFGVFDTALELQIYMAISCLTALAFFVLSSTFWGYAAVIGLLFIGVTFLMAFDLRFAPLEFGITWATVLVYLGRRLRRLGGR